MSEITVTRGANVVSHSALVHGAERSLRAYSSTTEWTEAGQATLCRPSRRFGRYGAQLTTKAINCANCLHVLRKAEAEARETDAAIDAIEAAGSVAAVAGVETVTAKPVKLSETQREMLVGIIAWREIEGLHRVNGGVLVRFSKSNRVATLRALYNLGLVEQTASGERGQYGTTGSVYVKLTPAGWAAAEAIDADTLATWRAHRTAEIDADHAEALEINAELDSAHHVEMSRWTFSHKDHAHPFNFLASIECDHAEALELNAGRPSKVAALTIEYGQVAAWRARHGAGVAVQGGPVGSRTLDRDRIEADHAEALDLEHIAQSDAWHARHGLPNRFTHYERRMAIQADHAEALEMNAAHWQIDKLVLTISGKAKVEAHLRELAAHNAQIAAWFARHGAAGRGTNILGGWAPMIEADHAEALELNVELYTHQKAAQRPGAITEVFEVLWLARNGDEARVSRVALTAGYTTFGDIPAILATSHLGHYSRADLVNILSLRRIENES